MTLQARPHSLPVLLASEFRVTNGANLGDALSFADEVTLDDVYGLQSGAMPARLSLRPDGPQFTVSLETELGRPGATVCLDSSLLFMSPDGSTLDALVFVELDDDDLVAASYLLPLAPIASKTDYTLVGVDKDGARAKLAQVACVSFTRGTHITLASGKQVAIEDLKPGDRVLTRDDGPQEIRWIGQTTSRAVGEFAPIRIACNALNNSRDLVVSPDHRLFIYQRSDALGAGRAELMVKARHLINGDTVTVMEGGFVDYFQLLFDSHQIIYAEGIAAESLLVDPNTSPVVPKEVSAKLVTGTGTHRSDLAGLDVSEALLNRPDAAELLRRASSR